MTDRARHAITLRHNFETAHRLPHLGEGAKCASLHGHSWWAEVTVTAPALSPAETVAEFGAFKAAMRGWIDHYLDHGAMVGAADPLTGILRALDSKVFVFGEVDGGRCWSGAQWPTVEAVAELIADRAINHWLLAARLAADHEVAEGATVTRVRITETSVNAAEWIAG